MADLQDLLIGVGALQLDQPPSMEVNTIVSSPGLRRPSPFSGLIRNWEHSEFCFDICHWLGRLAKETGWTQVAAARVARFCATAPELPAALVHRALLRRLPLRLLLHGR